MSSAKQPYDPTAITKGKDRYARFAEDFIGLRLSEIQREVLETVAENQRTLIWGANGPGKSYITAALKLGFLYSNIDSIVLGTSGSYQQYEDTMWRPLKDMWDDLKEEYGLPGRDKGGNRPSIEIDNEWYAKIVSPRSPGELEGRHNADVLVVIDEADKKHVTEEHFDSAGSSITDLNDKMVAICNPPEDSNNVVAKKKESDRWKVIEISAFESHNAKIDAGLINDKPDSLTLLLLHLTGSRGISDRGPLPKKTILVNGRECRRLPGGLTMELLTAMMHWSGYRRVTMWEKRLICVGIVLISVGIFVGLALFPRLGQRLTSQSKLVT